MGLDLNSVHLRCEFENTLGHFVRLNFGMVLMDFGALHLHFLSFPVQQP